MLFTSSSAHDIEKYYYDTYTKFKEFGDRLFRITGIDSQSVVGVDEDDVMFELFLSDNHPYEVDYVLPHRAVFQYKKSAVLMQRVPARQYKRGLCSQNVRIISVDTGEPYQLTFPLLKAYVTKQKYFSFVDAINRKHGNTSYALNSRLSYTPVGKILRIDTTAIGRYDPSLESFFVHPLFVSEVQNQLRENSESYKVIPE